jgi:hypothetical protein
MDQPDLDRVIDEAAAQLVMHEPLEALQGLVMERIQAGFVECGSRRPLVWVSLGIGTAVAVLLLISLGARRESSAPAPVPAATVRPEVPVPNESVPSQPQPVAVARVIRRPVHERANVTVQIPDDSPAIERITIPVESPEPIAIPPIIVAATPQERIEIEPLTIEPLSATND